MDEMKTSRVYGAIEANTTVAGEWLGMGHIRDEVSGYVTRWEFDAIMIELYRSGVVVIAPEDNQKSLTSADRYNAVIVAGEERHLVCLVG